MAELFAVQYAGKTGTGAGAMYIGNGQIAGFDIYGGRYKGTYTEATGRLQGKVQLSMPEGGSLVTGQQMPAGSKLDVTFDWPTNFAGHQQQLNVGGGTVNLILQKMVDV
jgi:hypothetical protein